MSIYLVFVVLTLSLYCAKSRGVSVSALAMTGIKLTLEPRCFITSISRGFNLQNHVNEYILDFFSRENNLRMTRGSNEIKTSMYSKINSTFTGGLLFLSHEALMLIIEELIDGHPTIMIVDIITETRGINDG